MAALRRTRAEISNEQVTTGCRLNASLTLSIIDTISKAQRGADFMVPVDAPEKAVLVA